MLALGLALGLFVADASFLDACNGKASAAERRTAVVMKEAVHVDDCDGAWAALKERRELDLSMKDITTLAPLVGLDLVVLDVAFNKIADLTPLSSLKRLRKLNIHSLKSPSLAALAPLQDLEELDATARAVTNVDVIAALPKLRVLHMDYAQVTDLSPLANATSLRELWIGENPKLTDLSPLSALKLEHLRINGKSGVTTLAALASMTTLRELSVHGGPKLKNVDAIANLVSLEDLTLVMGTALPSLAKHTKLKLLHLEHGDLVDLAPIRGVTSITDLYLDDNKIESIEALRTLPKLTTLRISRNRITDLSPLAAVPLTHLEAGPGNRAVKDEAHCPTTGGALLAKYCAR